MDSNATIKSAFSSWKIALAIFLGLGIAGWMMYNSLQQKHFVETAKGKGTYSWTDANHNQKVDFQLSNEFKPTKNGDYKIEEIGDLLQQINWTGKSLFWMAMALVFMVGRDFAYMLRIKILTQKRLTWKSSFNVIMLWEFASALSPGVLGGTTVAMFILNKEKVALGRSTAIVVITAMMDNLFYVLLVPFLFLFIQPSLLFPSETGAQQGVEAAFWLAYIIFSSVCVLLFVSIFYYPQLMSRFLNFVFRLPFLKKWRNKAQETGKEIIVTSKEFKKESWKFWLGSFGATVLSWTSRYLVINCILAAFLNLSFNNHFFILGKQLVLWLLMRISPTPGGSGVAEYAFGELMSDFSHSALLLAGLALLWRLISYFPYLFIGALILPKWLKKKD